MRVLYFHQHFNTPRGTVGIRSYQMAKSLLRKGHQVTMVCGSYAGGSTGLCGPIARGRRRGVVDGIEVIEFDLAYSNADGFLTRTAVFISFALRSIALVFTEKYDIVFATTTPLTAGIPGIIARWLLGKIFVFEVRDLWPELPKAMGVIRNPFVLAAMSALEWVSYRSAHRLVALSPGIVEGIVRAGVPRDRIAMVPNSCDIGLFSGTAHAWRPPQVIASDLMAVFAGTHGIANGLDAVLDAAIELKRRGRNDIKFVMVGEGKLKSKLQTRAKREGLDCVVFCNPIDKASLSGLLAAADVGMQILANVPAFYYGTSPNKFFDYIAAGLPVVNNYPGWLADLISQHRCGFAVCPESPSAFADALEVAASDRAALKSMGERALALAAAEFNRDELTNRWVQWVIAGSK